MTRTRTLLATATLAALAIVAVVATLLLLRPTEDGTRSDAAASNAERSPSAARSSPSSSPTQTPTPTPTSVPVAEPPPAPVAPAPACVDDVLVCVNLARVANGLGELAASGTLNGSAQACADRMAASGQMTHSTGGPGGYSTWGENIAVGYPSAAAVFDGWMNSPGHRANILSPAYSEMGIGYASGNWWCQQFGS